MGEFMIELVNDTIRMRVLDPKKFSKFRTKDIGSKGKLSLIVGYDGNGWKVQSYRFNLSDYVSVTDVLHDARSIKGVSESDIEKIAGLTRKYFKNING
jgi:hypothetical protein